MRWAPNEGIKVTRRKFVQIGKSPLIRLVLKKLVRSYQIALSPLMAFIGAECRFFPSCSKYACACLENDDLQLAILKISRRLVKCGPWHPGGVDLP